MKSCRSVVVAVLHGRRRCRPVVPARDHAARIRILRLSSSASTASTASASKRFCSSSSASSSTLDHHHHHHHRPQIYHTTNHININRNDVNDQRIAFGSLLYRAHQLLDQPLFDEEEDDDDTDNNNNDNNHHQEEEEEENASSSSSTTSSSPSSTSSLLLQRRRRQARETLDCIFELSHERTPASVDLSLLLLDKLVRHHRQQQQLQQQQQQEEHNSNSSSIDYSLLDRDLWHSVLINWQQVSRELLTDAVQGSSSGSSSNNNNTMNRKQQSTTTTTTPTTTTITDAQKARLDDQLTSPQKLLALLDGWSDGVTDRDGQTPHGFATSKALSLVLDVCGRRGKLLERLLQQHQSNPHHAAELEQTAAFAETVLLRMMDKHRRGSAEEDDGAARDSNNEQSFKDDDDGDTNSSNNNNNNNNKHFMPSVDNLNMVLLLLGRTGQADRAWRLLQTASDRGVPPDVLSYNALLKAYLAAGDGAAAENVLRELLETSARQRQQQQQQQRGNNGDGNGGAVTPNVTCWNTVLAAWARADDKQLAAERVEQLLVTMMMMNHKNNNDNTNDFRARNHNEGEHDNGDTNTALSSSTYYTTTTQLPAVAPDLTTFNTALTAYARAGEADTCARLLGEMQDLYEAGRIEAPPDAISYGTTMNAFAKAGRPDMAEAYLEDMYAAFMQHGLEEMRPTLPTMTSVLDAYAKSIAKAVCVGDHKAMAKLLERARQMFHRMQAWHEYGFLPTRPDTTAFNVMMSCYLRASHADTAPAVNRAAEHADALLRLLKAQSAAPHQPPAVADSSNSSSSSSSNITNARYAPDFSSYSIVIHAWLQRPDGFPRAMEWLDEVWELHRAGTHPHIRIDAKSLHSMVVGISRRRSQPDAAQRLLLGVCEERRRDPTRTEAPRVASFGVIVASWQRSGHPQAPERAQALVDQLEQYHQAGVLPNGPDQLVYSTLVNCWTHSDLEGAAERGYSALTKMRQQAAQGDGSMEYPQVTTYANVIYAFSKGTVNAHKAERVLRELYDDHKQGRLSSPDGDVAGEKLDIKCFNAALSAWARSRDRRAPQRAEALFREILRLERNGEVQCDTATYNTLLNSLALARNRPSAERAERLVEQMMLDSAAAGGQAPPPPNAITFGSLIKAWVGLRDADRAERVLVRTCRAFLEEGKPEMRPQPRHFEQVKRVLRSTDATNPMSEQDRRRRLKALNDMRRTVLG